MLTKILIRNYKVFRAFDLDLNEQLNILVGNNEVGKSTLLEAINLALTKRLNGRPLEQELSPHLFNREAVACYLDAIKRGAPIQLPSIAIELHFGDSESVAGLRGSMNELREDACGVRLEVSFDEDYADEYSKFLASPPSDIRAVPAEYFRVHWRSFSGNALTARALPVSASFIDATTIRLQSGTDYYIQDIIRSSLATGERVALDMAYRRLKETFSDEASIQGINAKLTSQKGSITDKDLSIAIDISHQTSWESTLVPHLDELPFQLIGKGEQNVLKIMLALERKAGDADLVLVEEPENHLSYSTMNVLLARMRSKCSGKQMVVATHSAYVLNKLGLSSLILLGTGATATLKTLSNDTQEYFEKLAGYDTLRLVLAKKAILVEGPSDELIVQRAYLDENGCLPIEDGVDVISVHGLSFLRFLEIAKALRKVVRVVTDNDGAPEKVDHKYAEYSGLPEIRICRSDDPSAPSLEEQMLASNDRSVLNKIFGAAHASDTDLVAYMKANKTDWALTVFKIGGVSFPKYIRDAIQ